MGTRVTFFVRPTDTCRQMGKGPTPLTLTEGQTNHMLTKSKDNN